MSSLKQYQSAVKRVNESVGEARSNAIAEKRAIVEGLQAKARTRAEKRKLKFRLDEINNS